MKTGTSIDIYGTGQSSNSVQSNQVGFFLLRAASMFVTSNWGHPRPLGQSGTFDNPVMGLIMGDAV